MAHPEPDVFDRLERFYDAVPRDSAVAEDIGGLVLFVRDGAGWPYYARPRLGHSDAPTAADITAVRARQRALGVPEAFEWVHESTPDLLAVARSAGLSVLLAPLMVLDASALPPAEALSGVPVRLLDPAAASFEADLVARRAVAQVAFTADAVVAGGPALLGSAPVIAAAGPAERDSVPPPTPDEIAEERRRHAGGRISSAVAGSPAEGILSSGVLQRVGDVAEIAGVGTLPAARGRGLGSAVTAALAAHALLSGADLVFLSAASDDVARLYSKIGFRRVGTACIAEPGAEV
jgi:ribosomal protein S18 acetylase RimI-like enzyme